MATLAESLREIHRLRRYAKELQAKIDDLPRRLAILRDRVAYQETEEKTAKGTINKLKAKNKEDELTLASISDQIDKYKRQLTEIHSKKEHDALQHEIAHAKEKVDHLEDQILQTYTEIDAQTDLLPQKGAAVAKAQEELAEFESKCEPRKVEFQQELEKANNQLGEVEGSLPDGDFRMQYERLIRLRGDDAFSSITGKTCQACYTAATSQQSNELAQGKFVLCTNCGRILYLSE